MTKDKQYCIVGELDDELCQEMVDVITKHAKKKGLDTYDVLVSLEEIKVRLSDNLIDKVLERDSDDC